MEELEEQQGRRFRAAWISGVQAHYPGTPKPGYIAPWEEMSSWEQLAASAVYGKVRTLILAGQRQGPTTSLHPEQGGRYISEAWNVQVYRHIEKPKPGYVADWEQLPEWQRQVDIDIFKEIEQAVLQEPAQV
jgi:hypothetical protein